METTENPPSPEINHSTNITQDEIDQETATKLRGDAIGDTMYSEVFVLNTLMQFNDLKWSSEVENDLCFLWDMTEEKDVCEYLYKVSFPTLACTAIRNYTEPRFIEIVIGVFANILCSKCEHNLKDEEIKTVLDVLNSNDPYILIQVMRFIHAIAFMFGKLQFLDKEHFGRFNYILFNSTNKELLANTLKSLVAITDGTKLDPSVISGELLVATITGYKTLKNEECESENELFESQEQHLNVKHLVQIFCNVSTYIDNCNLGFDELKTSLGDFNNEIVLLLNFYTHEDYLIPLTEDFKYYIEALTYIYRTSNAEFVPEVVKPLIEIYFIVCSQDSSNLQNIAEVLCYFISVATNDSIRKNFECLPLDVIKRLFCDLETKQFCFEFDYLTNLRRIVAGLK